MKMKSNEKHTKRVTTLKQSKRIIGILLILTMLTCALASCGDKKSDEATASGQSTAMTGSITVISREDGSGTRGAFVELLGVVDADKNDNTVETAEITNSTSVMLTTVAGNKAAIGYVSLGSLSQEVKALKVDGVAATVGNIKDDSYKIARPFNLIYNEGDLSALASDFVSYIMSQEGQAVITEEGCISIDTTAHYKESGLSGKIALAGSTSVAPVMEKLAEAYKKLNSGVSIEIQQSGSSAGITSAIEGACDMGMSSRALTDKEQSQIESKTIAMDGIAVIVNKENALEGLTSDEIKNIFLGDITEWDAVGK